MSSRSSGPDIVDQAERKAERAGLELDDVRIADTDSRGTTVKLILDDAESETDQVYGPVEYIEGPGAEQMFSDRLDNVISDLKAYASDEEPDGITEDEIPDEQDIDPDEVDPQRNDATEDDQSDPVQSETTSPTLDTVISPEDLSKQPEADTIVELSVRLDDDSLTELEDSLEAYLGDVESDLTEAHERMDEIEARMDRIEETLGALGSLGD